MFFVGVIRVMVGEKLKTKFEILGSGDPRRGGGHQKSFQHLHPILHFQLHIAYSVCASSFSKNLSTIAYRRAMGIRRKRGPEGEGGGADDRFPLPPRSTVQWPFRPL